MRRKVFVLLFLGFLIRLILVPQPGFEADVAFWKSWSLAASEKGIVWLTRNTNYNYPAGFSLILWLMGRVYRLFADPNDFSQYWQANNYLFLLLCKLPSIFADLAIGWGLYYLLTHSKILALPKKSSRLALLISGLYLFHPVVLFDGAWWGQVDSLGVAFLLFSLIGLGKRKTLWASVLITTGFLIKLQVIVVLPLFFLYVWQAFSWKEMVKSLAASLVTFLVITIPFSLGRDLGRTFYLIIQNADWFPLLSLRAYNLWWLVSNGVGMVLSDKVLTFGITSAKTAGLIFFGASYLLAMALIFQKPDLKNLLASFVLAGFAFFILPTQSHERYIFPALVLSLLLIPVFWEKKNERRLMLSFFILLSTTTLLNLNASMVANYPENGLPVLSHSIFPSLGVFIAAGNLLLFLFFSIFIIRNLSRVWIGASAIIILGGFLFTNLAYLSRDKISLASLKPLVWQQDYGIPQTDRSVSSFFGPKDWSFLSVNYFFYRQGIGTHANSRLVFDLGKKFKRFSTDFGVDTEANAEASVIFEIYGDGKLLFSSPKMGKFDLPGHTEVPMGGVKTLSLVVGDGGDGIFGDHADWLNPILYK